MDTGNIMEDQLQSMHDGFENEQKERYELGRQAIELMMELLPTEEYEADEGCEALQNIICQLSGYDFK